MALSTATLQAQLDAIQTALATGETAIRTADGRMVQYDVAALERQRDYLVRQLKAASRGNIRLCRYNTSYDREVSGG
jgi:hypothetical protein